MTERDLTSYRQDTTVEAPQEAMPAANPVTNQLLTLGQDIIEKSQDAKINQNISQAQLDIAGLNQKYQVENQADPLKNMDDLKQQRDDILASYGEQISPYFKGSWNAAVSNLTKADNLKNETWAYTQMKKNTADNINQSIANNMSLANQNGQDFGTGKITSLDGALDYQAAKNQLMQYGNKNIGSEKTDTLFDSYDKDYMKSFITGVAQNNPQKAAQLLDSPQFKDNFDTQDRTEFANLIEKTTKSNELIQQLKIAQNSQQVTGIVNDPNQTYFQKRLAIDQLDMSGAISSKTASQARRVLTSAKDVDSVTSSDEMGGIVTKIYDLNSQQGMNNSDYLKGVQDLHTMILQKQADGLINSQDVGKLNNEMKTLTSKHVSDATNSVGSQMYDAVQSFKTLPPEWRGEATRQLFYATQGQQDTLTPDQYTTLTKNTAQKVIDNINQQRRSQAVKTLTQPAQPDDLGFLKTKGYTMDDVNETAKKYGTTPDEVIKRLRAKK